MTLRQKFEQARDRATALQAKPDRTDAENVELVESLDRAEALAEQLGVDERLDALATVSRAVQIPGSVELLSTSAPAELTAGEYVHAAAEFINGRISGEEFVDRAALYHDRAVGVSADVAGILPEPIVGPLIDLYQSSRKVYNSFSPRPMPAGGKTFDRPKITGHVAIGEQLVELDPLASQKFTLGSDPVTKRTLGGTLEVSRQMQDWTDPAALGLVITDFAKVYARYTETLAVAHLAGLATNVSPYVATSTAAIVKSFVDGALAAFDAMDNDDEPLSIWLGVGAASALAVPTGSTDRTVFAVVREALEAIDVDMNVTTSRRLPTDTRIIGAASLVESYEQLHGLLSVQKTNLATDISYSGYNAFAGTAAGFVSVEPVA